MFGGQKSTFGASSFGNTGFGASNPAGGLFSNTQQQQSSGGGLFGSNNTNQQSSFSFGSTNNTNTGGGLFGGTTANTGGGLFGNTSSTFGNTGSTFGSNNTGGLFGNNTQSSTTTSGMFGGSSFASQPNSGTQQKFEPFISSDTTPKGGDIKTRLLCYCAMPKYQGKSLIELRIEDYASNRKAGSGGGSLFGGGTSSTGLFGSSANTSSFGNTASTGTSLFGSGQQNNTGGSLFGNTTSNTGGSSLFGSKPSTFGANTGNSFSFGNGSNTNTNTGGGLFGNTTTSNSGSIFGNAQSNTSTTGGLFGNTNTSSTFGNTTGGLFGNTTQNNSGGLFGNQNKPATGGLFGNTTNTTTTGGLFGNTTQSSGGLFGTQNKPAGGGLFGNTTNTSTGGSLFGNNTNNTQQKTGGMFSFGNTSTATNNSGGLFGNTCTSSGGGLFGNNKPASGSLFGNTTNAVSGSLFGNSTSNNTASGSLFGNSQNNQSQQQSLPVPPVNVDAAIAHLIQYPFGDSPLFRNSILDQAKLQDQLKPVSAAAQKASLQPQYKVAATPTKSVLTPTSKSPYRSLFVGLDNNKESSFSASHLRPKQSVKKLTVKVNSTRKMGDSILFNKTCDDSRSLPTTPRLGKVLTDAESSSSKNDSSFHINSVSNKESAPIGNGLGGGTANGTLYNSTGLEQSIDPLRKDFKARLDETSLMDSSRSTPVEGILDENEKIVEPNSANVTLTRPDYYTKPPLSTLTLDSTGACWVEKFTIVRKNYGQIYWPGRVNLVGLDLDMIVDIKRKCASVYSEEHEHLKPEVGQGLNQKAEVSLISTYPRDKITNEIINDVERLEKMGWPEKLERATTKIGARFLDYDLKTGTWSFRVQHFSKYGLADSDDEIDQIDVKPYGALPFQNTVDEGDTTAPSTNTTTGLGGTYYAESASDEEQKTIPMEEAELMYSPREAVSFLPTADSLAGCQKIQDMKYSLFGEAIEEPNQESTRTDIILESKLFNPVKGSIFDLSSHRPPVPKKSCQDSLPGNRVSSPFSTTGISGNINRRTRCDLAPVELEHQIWSQILKSGLKFGSTITESNRWKCSWTRNCVSVHSGVPINIKSANKDSGILASAPSRSKGFCLNLRKLGKPSVSLNEVEKDNLSDCLDILLRYCEINDYPSCPHIEVNKNQAQELIHEMNQLAEKHCQQSENPSEFLTLQHEITSLIVTLWGTIDVHGNKKLMKRERKKRLKSWIQKTASSTIRDELENELDLKKRLNILLSAGDIQQARKLALQTGLEKISLLIPLASSETVQNLIRNDLEQWNETKLDTTINQQTFNIYQTIAGLNTARFGDKENNVLANVDWRRAFGFFLNYASVSADSISEALDQYKTSYSSSLSAKPNPKYKEKVFKPIDGYFPDWKYDDICYSLINFFCNGSDLADGKMFIPESFSSDPIDYRLVFVAFALLDSLDFNIYVSALQIILTSFASQLETNGLWHYACVVQMINPNVSSREKAVREILSRNVSLEGGWENEDFLLTQIGLNRCWICEIKAALALQRREYENAVKHLIDGKLYNKAHNIIVGHLASKWIMDGKSNELRELLQTLDHDHIVKQIEGWENHGCVLVDYFELKAIIEELQIKKMNNELDDDSQLIEMEPVLAGLVSRISGLNGEKAIDALARAELARGALHWCEVRQSILRRDNSFQEIESLVKSGRVPEEYALDSVRRAGTKNLISTLAPEEYALDSVRRAGTQHLITTPVI